jgi:hypothetical protein
MRKLFALALLALALAFVVMGCGQKAEEAPAPAATETPAMPDTGMGSADTSSTMAADSTAGGH